MQFSLAVQYGYYKIGFYGEMEKIKSFLVEKKVSYRLNYVQVKTNVAKKFLLCRRWQVVVRSCSRSPGLGDMLIFLLFLHCHLLHPLFLSFLPSATISLVIPIISLVIPTISLVIPTRSLVIPTRSLVQSPFRNGQTFT